MQAAMPVITVDGPSGSGKGTVCRLLAETLNWEVLDSGAIYRVLSLAALHHQIATDNEEGLVPLAANLDVQFSIDKETKKAKLYLKVKMLLTPFAMKKSAQQRQKLRRYLE